MSRFATHAAERDAVDLGVVGMRLIASSDGTEGAYALAEFRGRAGRWTVPHVHRDTEEAFLVTEGGFVFTCADEEIHATAGSFVRVPRDTRHMITADADGAALVALWVPGGLERMFLAMSELPPESITDPEARRRIAESFDSVPV